jgi:hypothetical protein
LPAPLGKATRLPDLSQAGPIVSTPQHSVHGGSPLDYLAPGIDSAVNKESPIVDGINKFCGGK